MTFAPRVKTLIPWNSPFWVPCKDQSLFKGYIHNIKWNSKCPVAQGQQILWSGKWILSCGWSINRSIDCLYARFLLNVQRKNLVVEDKYYCKVALLVFMNIITEFTIFANLSVSWNRFFSQTECNCVSISE